MDILEIKSQYISLNGGHFGDREFYKTLDNLLQSSGLEELDISSGLSNGKRMYSGEKVDLITMSMKYDYKDLADDYRVSLNTYTIVCCGNNARDITEKIVDYCNEQNELFELGLSGININRRRSNGQVFQTKPFELKKYLGKKKEFS